MASNSSERKHLRTKNLLTWTILLLVLVLVLTWVKYLKSEFRWFNYAPHAQQVIFQAPNYTAREEADMLSITLTTLPNTQNPLYKNSPLLENYILSVSNRLNRDIVVVDTNKLILADTISDNVGKIYSDDKGKEVNQTIIDGNLRSFEEISTDYPKGITQTVTPMRDTNNKVVGAILVSISTIH